MEGGTNLKVFSFVELLDEDLLQQFPGSANVNVAGQAGAEYGLK